MIKGQRIFGGYLDEWDRGVRQTAIDQWAYALEQNPTPEMVHKIQSLGLISHVYAELQRRANVVSSLVSALTVETATEHERAASKSQDEKKRASYMVSQFPELYFERGNKYPDLFWPCGTTRVDPDELSPMRPLRKEVADITAEYMDPDVNTVKVCESCAALWMRFAVTGELSSRCIKCGHRSWFTMSYQGYRELQAIRSERPPTVPNVPDMAGSVQLGSNDVRVIRNDR